MTRHDARRRPPLRRVGGDGLERAARHRARGRAARGCACWRRSSELGYRQNEVARSLKRRATHTLGVVIPDALNPFHATVALAGRAARPPRRLRGARGRDRERPGDRGRPGAGARRPPRRRRHLPGRDRGLGDPQRAARPRHPGGRRVVRGPRPAARHRRRRRVRGDGRRWWRTCAGSATAASRSPTPAQHEESVDNRPEALRRGSARGAASSRCRRGRPPDGRLLHQRRGRDGADGRARAARPPRARRTSRWSASTTSRSPATAAST